MFQYTSAFLNSFSWAKNAYSYMLGANNSPNISLDPGTLTQPVAPTINTQNVNIQTGTDWNVTTSDQVSTIAGIFKSIDTADQYYTGLYQKINSGVKTAETNLSLLNSTLKTLISSNTKFATTYISINGGDDSYIDSDESYYRDMGLLESNKQEGSFKLPRTGSISSARHGGFGGQVFLERSLGTTFHNGSLDALVDGSSTTFWQGKFYSPAIVRSEASEVYWLPPSYQYGYAVLITYYFDRPILATELYLDPVLSAPMDLVSVAWTPDYTGNSVVNPDFSYSATGWVLGSTATWLPSEGVQNTPSVLVVAPSGYFSQTFAIPTVALSASTVTGIGNRAQLEFYVKGMGDVYAGARLNWLDASGNIIDYVKSEDYPSGFYNVYRLVDYIPPTAVSGRIDLGIFTPSTTTPASAWFDLITLYLGENVYYPQETLTQTTTLSLPQVVRSSRFSFVFAQRNPKVEVLSITSPNANIAAITGNQYISNSLQQSTQTEINSVNYSGPGTSVFSYTIGLKELDLRYTQYIPKAKLVSLPLYSSQEIREIWVTSETSTQFSDLMHYYIYPFSNSVAQKSGEVQAYQVGNVGNATTSLISNGTVLKIYTYEEQASGWLPSDTSNVYLVSPQNEVDQFDGTDTTGRVTLSYAPHIRRPLMNYIQNWMAKNSILFNTYDPNLSIIYGLDPTVVGNQSIINNIRSGNITASGLFSASNLITTQGYQPIAVTVSNSKFTAVPDIFGIPVNSPIRSVVGEKLVAGNSVTTVTNNSPDSVSFEQWLNTTQFTQLAVKLVGNGVDTNGTLKQLQGYGIPLTLFSNYGTNPNELLSVIIDRVKGTGPDLTTNFQNLYNALVSQGHIPTQTSQQVTTTLVNSSNSTYQTSFYPIVKGPNGTFITLFWFDTTTNKYTQIPQSDFTVNSPEQGIIIVNSQPPNTFTTPTVIANYTYINRNPVADYSSLFYNFINSTTAGGVSPDQNLSPNYSITTGTLPITRNMTDYVNGLTPTLKPPVLDPLDPNYYPIIEYYVTPNSEIIFSRDFFKYGDMPSQITVTYQTLAIQPRVEAQIVRQGSTVASPSIFNIGLRVREGSPSPKISTVS